MNQEKNFTYINQLWDTSITPTLMEYMQIPNKSPQFDRAWQTHGYIEQAVMLIANWCSSNAVPNMTVEIIRAENRTPLLYIEIPGNDNDTVLLYGHLDKQPEMSGWDTDLGPWTPILRDDRLYGRGGADDGYAVFAALTAIKSLHMQQIPHARCVIIIESCEESGSLDLPYYLEVLKDRIAIPSLVICLDSGCGNYEQLWLTTSLRGLISGTLNIEVLEQGIHSGLGSGVVPSCFRILRQLLDRIENKMNGDILLNDLHVEIPPQRVQQIEKAATIIGNSILKDLPALPHVAAESSSPTELLLRRTWKPALSITGVDGIPPIEHAGNVNLPNLAVKLSLRLPPTCDADKAATKLKNTLEQDPPYHANVHFQISENNSGWNAPAEKPWLTTVLAQASQQYFTQEAAYLGEGGSIPFMSMLGKKFPQTQFVITGVLGPHSNAHGPNEFLHIPTAKKLTACIANVIAAHYKMRNL